MKNRLKKIVRSKKIYVIFIAFIFISFFWITGSWYLGYSPKSRGGSAELRFYEIVQKLKLSSNKNKLDKVYYIDQSNNIQVYDMNSETNQKLVEANGFSVKKGALSDKGTIVYEVADHNKDFFDQTRRLYLYPSRTKKFFAVLKDEGLVIKRKEPFLDKVDPNCASPRVKASFETFKWSQNSNYFAVITDCGISSGRYWRVDVFDSEGSFVENFYKGDDYTEAGKWESADGEDYIDIPASEDIIFSPKRDRKIIIEWGLFYHGPSGWANPKYFSHDLYLEDGKRRRLLFSSLGRPMDIVWGDTGEYILFRKQRNVYILETDFLHKPTKVLSNAETLIGAR